MTFVALYDDDRLPLDTIILEPPTHSDHDLAFLSYIIHCFETRTNIQPTVFIRYVPQEHDTNILEVIHNMANALVDIPFIIPGKTQLVINTNTQLFQGDYITKNTEKPTLFGVNLLALLKHTHVTKLRALRQSFINNNNNNTQDTLGHFWMAITHNLL